MYTPSPRKMMSVNRMIKQRDKHHPIRYMIKRIPRDWLVASSGSVYDTVQALIDEWSKDFREDVFKWNFSRKAPLGPITTMTDFDLYMNEDRVIFEVRRLPTFRS